jgi:carbamoyl-phosphate synthase small subunit
MSLSDYLKANNVVAIAGIDTRRLTRILREKGAQNGCIMAGDNISEEAAIAAARLPGPEGHGPGESRQHQGKLRVALLSGS